MGDMVAFGVQTFKVLRRSRPPRSRYFHLTTEQLNRLSKVVENGRQIDIVKAASNVGLTQAQLKEAVQRWREDQRPPQYIKVTGTGGGGGGGTAGPLGIIRL